jgi:two-component system cell cycle sensor histidine kinase/response regulator CckA
VHGIVAAHNGLIAVESAPGAGTMFRIYLPLERRAAGIVPAAAAADEQAASAPVCASGKERVLLVDDETDITDVLLIGLDRLGYEVAAVTDPLEALATFEEDPDAFDVVLSDFSMPGLDGTALIRRLREIRPGLRTILWSGLDRQQVEGSFGTVAHAFLQKPSSPHEVGLAIRGVMAH